MFILGIGGIPVIGWAKTTYYDPKFTAPKLAKSQKELEGSLYIIGAAK